MSYCKVSVVIRTKNEDRFLEKVLEAIKEQLIDNIEVKVIVVDSGSTDNTLKIAENYNAVIVKIDPCCFTFGSSLNIGFNHSDDADVVVSLSGHCIPINKYWLKNLVSPIINSQSELVFGKHDAANFVRTSERNYFYSKYKLLRQGYVGGKFFNNGNSAIKMDVWRENKFDECLAAQEDIEFALRVCKKGVRIYYQPAAEVIHIHDDSNIKIYKRLVREMHVEIMLDVRSRVGVMADLVKIPWLILHDSYCAYQRSVLLNAVKGIVGFRLMQLCASVVVLYKSYS